MPRIRSRGRRKSIGAWQLARSAETAESMRRGVRTTGSAGALVELERLVGETNEYIETLLSEAAAGA